MSTIMSCIKKHSVLTYYVLAFAISWGIALVLLGPDGFLGAKQTTETLIRAGLLGLLGPSLAGIFLIAFVHGRTGLRELMSRLLKWRVGARWYAVALLTAPLIYTAITLILLQTSRDFLPAILTSEDKDSLLLAGLGMGILVAMFEELGWTGFVTPQLRQRYGILTTGLLMGLLWGVWHYPLFSESALSSKTISPVVYLVVLLFSWLLPYRILMVWVYDRTGSLLLAILMHIPITAAQVIRAAPAVSNVQVVIDNLLFAAALWVFVAVVQGRQILTQHGQTVSPGQPAHPSG